MCTILREYNRAALLVIISWLLYTWVEVHGSYICNCRILDRRHYTWSQCFSLSLMPGRMATFSFHVESGVLDKNVGEKKLHNLALNITCHKQHTAFNIQNKTSLSHSRRPFWQKPSHSCQEYRVQLRTNFKMNLKSICHQIFMPLPDYLWHFNYKHPRRGVLQILTLGSYNKLYWQPLSACSTNLE